MLNHTDIPGQLFLDFEQKQNCFICGRGFKANEEKVQVGSQRDRHRRCRQKPKKEGL